MLLKFFQTTKGETAAAVSPFFLSPRGFFPLYLSLIHISSKARGDELGLDVILGAELRFPENDNDYLVYGIDEAWLRANPYLCCMRCV